MEEGITYVGLDAHQASTVVAVILPTGELLEDRFATDPEGVRRWVRRLKRRSKGPIVSCYEAGPTGDTLQRLLEGHGLACRVIAPSLIPHKPGERIKTDRRDARKLVELLAADLLTEVHAPTPEQEAIRDLCRARTSVKGDQKRIQHRLSKFLLRRGIRWTTGRRGERDPRGSPPPPSAAPSPGATGSAAPGSRPAASAARPGTSSSSITARPGPGPGSIRSRASGCCAAPTTSTLWSLPSAEPTWTAAAIAHVRAQPRSERIPPTQANRYRIQIR